jgi:hypothetical protein
MIGKRSFTMEMIEVERLEINGSGTIQLPDVEFDEARVFFNYLLLDDDEYEIDKEKRELRMVAADDVKTVPGDHLMVELRRKAGTPEEVSDLPTAAAFDENGVLRALS